VSTTLPESRIVQGDCRDLIDLHIPDGEVTCCITDPPYGVNFVSRRAATPQGKRWVAPVANDAGLDGALDLFAEVMANMAPKFANEAELYVFTRWDIVDVWMGAVRALEPYGFAYKMLLVWDKGIPGMGDIDSNWGCGHELILYAKKGRREVPYRRSGIIAVDKVHASEIVHPTEKPVGLLERFVEMSTNVGDLVVDPFAGSGSTVVAANRLGRVGVGFELDERYVTYARSRLEQGALF
jgi:site-specific DNA-methyltransferase (adenine-specific)